MKISNLWQHIQTVATKDRQALAIADSEGKWCYQELINAVNHFIEVLQQADVKQGDRVAVLMPRNRSLPAWLLAILAVGACYVPLSPRAPRARNLHIMEDASCQFLVSEEVFEPAQSIRPFMPDDNHVSAKSSTIGTEIQDCDLAYILYTSGSTGKPKGVMISRGNMQALLQWGVQQFAAQDLRYTLAATSLSFDLSVFEIFLPLVAGQTVIIADDILCLINNPPNISPSLINTVPSAAKTLLAQKAIPDSVRVINLAGEALEQSLVDSLYQYTKAHTVYNLYGPTETTTYSSFYPAKPGEARLMVPIGKPINGTEIYILDKRQQILPPLAKGDIYIVGEGVTQGYCNRPTDTHARFLVLTIRNQKICLYKTGDIGRYLLDGNLEYLGRADDQVKLNGFRIETGEICARLKQHLAIEDAVVAARACFANSEWQQLLAWVVPAENTAISTESCRTWLAQWLPDYMIPQHIMVLETLPLNSNGKVDKAALPLPDNQEAPLADWQNPLEETLVNLWKSVLGEIHFHRHDNFFHIGGHSLLAAQLLARYRSHFQITCQLSDLFQHSTIALQAAWIAINLQENKCQQAVQFNQPRSAEIPLSYEQTRLWFLQYSRPDVPISNIPILIEMTGKLDIEAFEKSMEQIIERHEILRTVYHMQENILMQQVKVFPPFKLSITHISAEQKDLALLNEANLPFDLSRDCMVRGKLFITNDTSCLMITQHHIASDAWSLNIFMGELSSLYTALLYKQEPPTLPTVVQYADYSCWQQHHAQDFTHELAYWKQSLQGAPAQVLLPFDRPKGAIQTFNGAFLLIDLPENKLDQLQQLAQQKNGTLFMVLLTGFVILLHRYSSQVDFCTGILSANRPHQALSQTLGFFVNTLVMRHRLQDGMRCEDLLDQIRDTVLKGLEHQSVPFEQVVQTLCTERSLQQHPLFNVLFSLQNALDTNLNLQDLTLKVQEYDRKIAKFDLSLAIMEQEQKLAIIFEYNTDLFDKETIVQIAAHYECILTQLPTNLSESISALDLLTEVEYQTLVVEMNQHQKRETGEMDLMPCFLEMAHQYPRHPAIMATDIQINYQQLHSRILILADMLIEYGMQPGMPVGILLPKGVDAIVSMLAIIYLGGYYLPLSPDWPAGRLEYIIRDTGVFLIIGEEQSCQHLPATIGVMLINTAEIIWEKLPTQSLEMAPANKEALCYVMYTSGSTGEPKGVLTTREGVLRLVKSTNYVRLDKPRMLQVSPLIFDGSTFDIWGSLLNGGTLVLMPDGLPELKCLAEQLITHSIDTLFLTTQLFNHMVEYHLSAFASLEQVLFGGEAASSNFVQRFKTQYPDCTLSNIYGPTECTTFALSHVISQNFDPGKPIALGKPLTNTSAIILNEAGRVCPPGIKGEIHLGGSGLALGYLNQASLTATKFIPNPFPELAGTRLYKTGDSGYYNRDGDMVFAGRVDNQIKLRGHRIEPGEIEQALRNINSVREALVTVQKDCLVAFISMQPGLQIDITQVRKLLAVALPKYMLPDAIHLLDHFQLNANGKIDRQQLPVWQPGFMTVTEEIDVADNDYIAIIRDIWKEVLEHTRIGSQDNFFEIGGNSIKIMVVLDKLTHAFRDNANIMDTLTIMALFQYPTLKDLSQYLANTLPVSTVKTRTKRVMQQTKRQSARLFEPENQV